MHLVSPTSRHWPDRRALYAVALSAVVLAGCSDSPTGPRGLPVTVSGSLNNRSGAAIPANARVVVLWAGDDGSGDYAYVFGEGTVDAASNRFTVTFDRDVPSPALLGNILGVGLVILTTDPNLREGRVPDGYNYGSTVIGVTGQHAVIYLNEDPPRFGSDWPSNFRRGYNVGRGVDLPGTFDGFAPTGLSAMELIVDDLANIETVNWT
ncbi:MAG: hypothetical protein ABR499_00875 [Gemmatimonadaceae bacterium]